MAESPAMDRPPLRQTFGVEVECRMHEPADDWKAKVVDCIRVAGYPALTVDEATTAAAFYPEYGTWQVGEDDSITEDPDMQKRQLEISSRVLTLDSGLEEIQSALNALNNTYTSEVDESCGLHVHQGNSERGWPLRTLCNVMLLQVAFEHLFNQLHPWHRNTNISSVPHSKAKRLAGWPAGYLRVSLLIATCNSMRALLQYTQPLIPGTRPDDPDFSPATMGRNCAVNLWSMRTMRTIEFRQHAATTDPEAITNWIELTGTWVRFAHNVDDEELGQLLLRCTDTDFTIIDLLISMGCEQHVLDYYNTHFYNHEAEMEIPQHDDVRAKQMLMLLRGRASRMEGLEQKWRDAGIDSTRTFTSLSKWTPSRRGEWDLPYLPWNELPFDYPWDVNMAAAFDVPLAPGMPGTEHVARVRGMIQFIPVGKAALHQESQGSDEPIEDTSQALRGGDTLHVADRAIERTAPIACVGSASQAANGTTEQKSPVPCGQDSTPAGTESVTPSSHVLDLTGLHL